MKILNNGIAIIETDPNISKWVEEEGRLDHDQNMLPIIMPYIKEGDWVIDGGAFIGDHTIAYLNRVGKSGMVLAFEPNPSAFGCLAHNCRDAICFNAGLSNQTDRMGIVENQNAGASYLHGQGDKPVFALDSIRVPRLNFIKLDIEGMELRALQGAGDTIARHKPFILLEINRGALARFNTTPEVLVGFVENFGYRSRKIYGHEKLTDPQLDMLFIPL